MLHHERHIETHQHQPKMYFSKSPREHPATYFWKPVVDASKDCENRASKEDVIKVRHQIVRVRHLPIDRKRREGNATQTSDGKHDQKTRGEKH